VENEYTNVDIHLPDDGNDIVSKTFSMLTMIKIIEHSNNNCVDIISICHHVVLYSWSFNYTALILFQYVTMSFYIAGHLTIHD